jgi:hypothetical protein
MTKKSFQTKKSQADMLRREGVRDRLKFAAVAEIEELFANLATGHAGLTEDRVEEARDEFGDNIVTHG